MIPRCIKSKGLGLRTIIFWVPTILVTIGIFAILYVTDPPPHIKPTFHYASPRDTPKTSRVPRNCGYTGTENQYGLGVRLGIYLQFAATLLSTTIFKLKCNINIRGLNWLFQIAMLSTVAWLAIKDSRHLQAMDVCIVTMFAMLAFVAGDLFENETCKVPKSITDALNSAFTLLKMLPCYGYSLFCIWVCFIGLDEFQHPSCTGYTFLFTPVYIYDTLFRTFLKVSSIFTTVYLFGTVFFGAMWSKVFIRRKPTDETLGAQHIRRRICSASMKLVAFVWFLFLIIDIELTIYWNNIGGVNTLNSVGQPVAFMLGLNTLVTVLYEKYTSKVTKPSSNSSRRRVDTDEEASYYTSGLNTERIIVLDERLP